MASLCLNMIVKNESHIIEETLESICKYLNLDYWVISDTGSTDNTIEIIENFFKNKNIPGEIHQEAWQDFAYNRNKALDACAGKADYVLFFDADDLIEGAFVLPELEYDGYYLQFREDVDPIRYNRCAIVKNNQTYRWVGVLHEVIQPLAPLSVQETILQGDYSFVSRRLGHRNLDVQKTLKDALILEKAFAEEENEPLKARYAFYCAQSYAVYALEDSAYKEKAIEWYKKRVAIDLSNQYKVDDEAYISYEFLGELYNEKNDVEQAIYYWEEGTELDPDRAECWYRLARIHHLNGKLELAYRYIKQGVYLSRPDDLLLFINQDIYDYWCWYELCVISWNLRKLSESYTAFKNVIKHLPVQLLSNLNQQIKSYKKLIEEDAPANIKALEARFAELGVPDYLEKLALPTLCLNMIVKNESHVVTETLECICKYVDLDYWVISDTGSTDNTIQIIEDFFAKKGIPGEIHQHEWQDFGHNRNKALDACEGKADYVMFFDADDLIQGEFILPKLEHDGYYLQFTEEEDSVYYTRRLIIKNNKKYKWVGVLHEVIHPIVDDVQDAYLQGDYSIISRHIGDRNLNPEKELNDALILEKAFAEEQDELFKLRNAFYCAQSYRGFTEKDPSYVGKAIEWYEKRVALKSINEVDDEKYMSYRWLGTLYLAQKNEEKVVESWLKGTELDPLRAECWYQLVVHHRVTNKLDLAYEYAKKCIDLPLPSGQRMMVDKSIYEFWCLYEMCVITAQLNKTDESYAIFKRLLPKISAQQLPAFNPIVSLYGSLLKQEDEASILEMKNHLIRLGRPHYFDGILRAAKM